MYYLSSQGSNVQNSMRAISPKEEPAGTGRLDDYFQNMHR